MNDHDEIEKALVDASEMIAKEGGTPTNLWHPEFGWVLRDGKTTDTTASYLEFFNLNQEGTKC